MVDHFDLSDPKQTFDFIFQLYNVVSMANEDNDTLGKSGDEVNQLLLGFTQMKLPVLRTGNLKRAGESDILSDVAILDALEWAGYIIPSEDEEFTLILPVSISLP